ncbi:MAG: response regulator [Phycisphaerales bacterium]|nr:response regulator [Phycisphaerales bacterium]
MPPLVLFLSPFPRDASEIALLIKDTGAQVIHARSIREAGARLRAMRCDVVLTEAELEDGSWRDVVRQVRQIAGGTEVVITHPFADVRLWAEAINLGAYDVLPQPFEASEVKRILSSAARRTEPLPAPAAAAYFG